MKKKLLAIVIFSLLVCNFSNAKATWGIIGDKCFKFTEYIIINPEVKKIELNAEIRGFLTALNITRFKNKEPLKNITYHTEDYVFNFVKGFCKENPDQHVFMLLELFFNDLPNGK